MRLELKFQVKPRGNENAGDVEEGHHEGSDSESSPLNSPGSVASSVLSVSSNTSGTNFTGSSVSSSASSGGTCSETVTEDEDEEKEEIVDECVDDWEAIADALVDNDKKHTSNSDLQGEQELSPCLESSCQSLGKGSSQGEVGKPQLQRVSKFNRGTRAWRVDDAFRPHGLPNLSKQRSLPLKSSTHLVPVTAGSGSFNNVMSVSIACDCPICYEELDVTDASFFPCPCGFRMCLFCYKRICEDDGRCPGCRKQYKNKESLDSETSFERGCSTYGLTNNPITIKDQRK